MKKMPCLRQAAFTAWIFCKTMYLHAAPEYLIYGTKNTPPYASAIAMTKHAKRSNTFYLAILCVETHSHSCAWTKTAKTRKSQSSFRNGRLLQVVRYSDAIIPLLNFLHSMTESLRQNSNPCLKVNRAMKANF